MGDAFDPPVLGAQREYLADRRFPDEFLVQFADRGVRVAMPQREVPPIGDRTACRVQREHCAAPRMHGVGSAVHRQPRLQRANTRTGIASRQHFEHKVELRARQVVVGGRAPHCGKQRVDVPGFMCGHRDELLGEHVQCALHRLQRFDVALADGCAEGRRHEEVVTVAGHQGAA